MEKISSKKIYLSIILVLFILFSLLFIPCCKVFAIDYDEVAWNKDEVFDYVTENYSFTGYMWSNFLSYPSLFFLVEPGGNFWAPGGAASNISQGYNFFIHKDEPDDVLVRKTARITWLDGYTDVYKEYEWPPYYDTGFMLGRYDIWSNFEFDNTLPVLVVKTYAHEYDGYEESSGLSLIYGSPTIDISIDMDKSSKEANVPGSIVGNLTGSFFDQLEETGGHLTLGLSKNVGNKFSFVTKLIDVDIDEGDLVDGSFNFVFSCPALELGHYVLAAHYETDSIELDDMTGFMIDGTINDVPRDITVGGNTYKTDSYFRKVFHFIYPRNNYLYDELNPEKLMFIGDVKYFNREVNHGKFSFNDNFTIESVAEDMKVNVFINDYMLTTCDISIGMDWTPSLSPSLLNRGRNSAYITSFSFRDEPDEIYSYKIGDKYYYLFDAIDFYYKTTEGSGDVEVTVPDPNDDRLVGGREGDPWDIPGSGGGIGFGSPPNRSDYPDDILGTLNYFIDWIAYIISIPINLLIAAFDWLVNVFTSLFYWVGQLSALIGSWFNFLPIEVRSLLMASFVASIVAFVLRLFRK